MGKNRDFPQKCQLFNTKYFWNIAKTFTISNLYEQIKKADTVLVKYKDGDSCI